MNDAMFPGQAGIWKTLLKEWADGLGGMEKQLLKLEGRVRDRELIGELLGMIRRVKRGSAFVGATGVTKVAHELETALRTMRDNEIDADAELTDLLLSAAEVMEAGIRALGEFARGERPPREDGALALPPDAEARWSGIVRHLHACFERRRPAAPAAGDGGAAESGAVPAGSPEAAKERLLIDCFGHADRMSECIAALEQEAGDRRAVDALASAAHDVKTGLEKLMSVLPADDAGLPAVRELLDAARPFAQWLASIRDSRRPLSPDWLDLCRETADYVKSALDAAASGSGAAGPNPGLPDRIRGALAERPAGRPAVPAGAASAGEPAQRAALPQSIRVSQDKLDKMMNMISELLIAKNAFMHLSARLNREYNLPALSKEVKEVGFSVNRITDELQNAIMSIRMVEVKTVFQKMPRIVRDVAQLTGKKMELVMEGETTEIDKTIVEHISDPIVHLIRNAADHGIEPREERLRQGKSETGRIALRAYNKDKHVWIEIEDDGKGIDPQAVKRKALEKGLIAPEQADRMTRGQLLNLIFLPGFSTAGKITEVSGRGVGMDIVKSNIEKINGTVAIDSEIGKGTKVVIRLPLTLAISSGLIVEAAQEQYIIPIESISETVKIHRRDIHELNGRHFAAHKGEVIGVEWLARLFLSGGRDLDGRDEFPAVIITAGGEKFGLIVDRLRNEQEFVIKALHGQLAAIPGISGSTLLGDGRVVLIVNPADLIRLAQND